MLSSLRSIGRCGRTAESGRRAYGRRSMAAMSAPLWRDRPASERAVAGGAGTSQADCGRIARAVCGRCSAALASPPSPCAGRETPGAASTRSWRSREVRSGRLAV